MPRISVVVPVFDVEAYLAACLQSIARQSERDLEVIVVDDGSSDASRAIAERFAERDPRFRVVAQPNGGLGSARNTGVAHAGGEFLAFVDGDDVVRRRRVPPAARVAGPHRIRPRDRQRAAAHAPGHVAGAVPRPHVRPQPRAHPRDPDALAAGRPHGLEQAVPALVLGRARVPLPRGRGPRGHPGDAARPPRADRVDVLAAPVYQWRLREDGARSITQRRLEWARAARPPRRRRRGHGALPRPRDRDALALVRPQRRRRRPAAAPQPARRGRRGLPRAVLHARQRAARPRVAADLRGAARDRPRQVAAGPARPARRAGGAAAVREGAAPPRPPCGAAAATAPPTPRPRACPRRRSGSAGATRTSR